MEVDFGVFSIGVGTGAAIAAVWFRETFAKYAVPCGNANCPHHRKPKPPEPPKEIPT